MLKVTQREGGRGKAWATQRGSKVCVLPSSVHCLSRGGGSSLFKKLTVWEAAQAIAHIPEGVRTMILWLPFTEHLPWAGPLSAQPLHKMSNLILILRVWYYCLHFTENQTVAQRGQVPYPMSHRWWSSDANREI